MECCLSTIFRLKLYRLEVCPFLPSHLLEEGSDDYRTTILSMTWQMDSPRRAGGRFLRSNRNHHSTLCIITFNICPLPSLTLLSVLFMFGPMLSGSPTSFYHVGDNYSVCRENERLKVLSLSVVVLLAQC